MLQNTRNAVLASLKNLHVSTIYVAHGPKEVKLQYLFLRVKCGNNLLYFLHHDLAHLRPYRLRYL